MAKKRKPSVQKKRQKAKTTAQPELSPQSMQFVAVTTNLNRLGYKERRRFLWNRTKPRTKRFLRFLYKFRVLDPSDPVSVNRIRDVVVRSRLWLSSPADFNDPFDMSAKFVVEGTIQEKLQRFKQLQKFVPRMNWAERKRQLHKAVAMNNQQLLARVVANSEHETKETGVYSFAGDPRSILMWSHCGANHEGLCFVFEVARDPKLFLQAAAVEYKKEYPVVNWIKFSREGMKAMALRKYKNWEYEKEKRLVFPNEAHTYKDAHPAALKAIILGVRLKETTLAKLREVLAERSTAGMSPVTLYRCKKHESKYKLRITKEDSHERKI